MKRILYLKEQFNVQEEDFLHILTIILRANTEIDYAKKRMKWLNDFILNEMENFTIEKHTDKIKLKCYDNLINITVDELGKISEEIYNYLNENYNIGFNYKNFDPVYMSLFLYKHISKITNVVRDEFYIDDFRLLRRNSAPVTLESSESYKALKRGHECEIYTPFNSNRLVDNDYERLVQSLDSIKKYGYPYGEQYIIVYNDQPYIRDGQHRASILKHLYGNIKVPILRIYIKGDLNDD